MSPLLLAFAFVQDPGIVTEYYRVDGDGFAEPAVGAKPLLVRIEPQINIPLAEGEFPGTRLAERFFVRWTGLLRCPKDGLYGFYAESDDGCRVFVDGDLVLDHRASTMMEQKSERVVLKAGDHALRFEYFQGKGPAGANLQWKPPGAGRSIVPPAAFFHAGPLPAADTAAWEALPALPPRTPITIGRPGRYAVMDHGSSLARSVKGGPQPLTTAGLCIRVGPEAAVLFDTRNAHWVAAWRGKFLKFPVERDGVAGFPEIAGRVGVGVRSAPGSARFLGHHVHGSRVVLSLDVDGVGVLEMPGYEDGAFTQTLRVEPTPKTLRMRVGLEAPLQGPGVLKGDSILEIPPHEQPVVVKLSEGKLTPAEDPLAFTKGGPSRWKDPIVLKGALGREPGGYAVDTVPVPEENPWDSYMRITGLDFFPDGRAAVSTLDGDVWIVSGIDATLEKVSWRRFAAGLYQPMGLCVRDGLVYALGRDQITRLRDLDGDGEADAYENFNNESRLSGSFHEFSMDLQQDAEGNFYFAKAGSLGYAGSTPHNGCVFKVTKEGRLEVLASGFRTPFGLCVGPDGTITATDQQGHWMGTCPIFVVKKGGYYGHPNEVREEHRTAVREPALCWIPMDMDNSSGGQVWCTSDRWGPLKGSLIHTSYGQAKIFAVLFDEGAGRKQGGVARFPLSFSSGIHRARFSPADGQLYVAGMRGWQTTGVRDGCLQRVRWTGKAAALPVSLRTRPGAVELGFPEILDPEVATDAESFAVQAFDVTSTAEYGSPEFLPSDPAKRGRETWEVSKASLGEGGRRLILEIPKLKPVTCLVIRGKLRLAGGAAFPLDVSLTLNR
jgi:hypothetical protein